MMWTGLILAFTAALAATEPLEVKVSPRSALAPATLRVTAFVEPHEDNHSLTIVADAVSHRSSTTVPLEGADELMSHSVTLERVPAGDYVIEATVRKVDGTSITRSTTAHIVE